MIPEMNTSRKAMEWLFCFSIVNLMFGCLLFKKFKKFNESCSSAFLNVVVIVNVSMIQIPVIL